MLRFTILLALAVFASASTLFEENFADDDGWKSRWVVSEHKGDEAGELKTSAGKWYGDEKEDVGLQTSQDAKFYQFSAKLPKEFSNKDKDLVLQYSVKHEQSIDCGGGYVKLLPAGLDQADFQGDSDYNIMFGPDICGATKRTHVIFNHDGKNHLVKKEVRCESDDRSHLYTLIVRPDNTYEVLIDNESKQKGALDDSEHFDILPPKEINDPDVSKPEDWVDEAKIDDPDAVKPDDWVEEEEIVDPDAEKPEDWDDELDGEWEAPMISNPEYKGPWKAPKIDNPDYKGPWVHPKIPNPDRVENPNLYAYDSHAFVGIEIWQVKSGTIFDNFLVTDSVEEASAAAEAFLERQAKEKEMYDEIKKQEREKAEAEAKAAEEAAAEEEEEEEEEAEEGHEDL